MMTDDPIFSKNALSYSKAAILLHQISLELKNFVEFKRDKINNLFINQTE